MMIRLLEEKDYNEFLKLIQDFRETSFTKEDFVNQLGRINASGEVWVVEAENGSLLATGTIFYEHKFIFNMCVLAHIEDVCVKLEHRRSGIGKVLVKHLMTTAKEKKCYKVTLDCADHNIPFYDACGLEKRGNQMCQLTEHI